jgi:two-component system, OmpR family, alkaline phosphatase synthesis response regulator PhoP
MFQILVIEDELTVRENIVDLLETENYKVITTENGFRGLVWASEHVPDLIISDVTMPEIDGYDILRALRQSPITAAIPFIFLSALSSKSDIRYGMDLGADDYLTKPYTRADLLSAVASRIKKNKMLPQQKLKPLQLAEAALVSANTLRRQFDNAAPKIRIAIHVLNDLEPGARRDQCIELLKNSCAEEIELLNQIPNIEDFLPLEDLNLLRQLMRSEL